jgi:hypothetical protein
MVLPETIMNIIRSGIELTSNMCLFCSTLTKQTNAALIINRTEELYSLFYWLLLKSEVLGYCLRDTLPDSPATV